MIDRASAGNSRLATDPSEPTPVSNATAPAPNPSVTPRVESSAEVTVAPEPEGQQLARLVVVVGLSELCFSGPVGIGLVLPTAERHWRPAILGWALSVFSIGGAVTGILLTALARVPRAGGHARGPPDS